MAAFRRRATFQFFGELNDFLPPARRMISFAHAFELHPSVKDVIESLGVPHTETDLILVNDAPVDFAYSLQDGDQVSVYPAFSTLDANTVGALRAPLHEHRFVLDTHLGRLARYLRLLGFDSVYQNDFADDELARISHNDQRILLTRDTGLLKRSEVVYGYFVRSTEAKEQTVEVIRRYDLFAAIAPFRRCLRCNTLLVPVAKERIVERLQPKTREYFDEFRICPACDHIYWPGSHYQHMNEFVREIVGPISHHPTDSSS